MPFDNKRDLPLILSTRSGYHLAQGIRKHLVEDYLPQRSSRFRDEPREIWVPSEVTVFADTGSKFTISRNVRGRDVYIIADPYSWATLKPGFEPERHAPHVVHLDHDKFSITQDDEVIPHKERKISLDANVKEIERAVDIAKESTTNRGYVTVVMPCHPYARQDDRSGRESLDLQMFARNLESLGADLVLTLDIHNQKAAKNAYRYPIKIENLKANHTIVEYLQSHYRKYPLKNAHFVAPDDNALQTNVEFARELGLYEQGVSALVKPDRNPRRPNALEEGYYGFVGDKGNVKGADIYMRDDLIDTGGTIIKGARYLKNDLEARTVTAIGTHAILSAPAIENFQRAHEEGIVDAVLLSDSVTQSERIKNFPVFQFYSVHKLLAKAINELNDDGSIQNLT